MSHAHRARGSAVPGGPAHGGHDRHRPRAPRRHHAVWAGLLLSVLALGLTAARWAFAPVAGVLEEQVVAVTGVSVAPALTGLAALAVAATLLLALAGPVLARISGVVLAVAGLGLALVPPLADPRAALESAAADTVGTPELAGDVATTLAPWGVTLTGAALAVLGLAVALRAGTWPRVGRRFERSAAPTIPAAESGAATAVPGAATSADVARADRERALDAWEALERGEDPTAPEGDGPQDPR